MPVAYAGVLTKPVYIKIHTLHPTPHLTEKMAHLLIFSSLVSTWKNGKPQQRLKTIHTLILDLRIMEEGKGYSKGVGPFRGSKYVSFKIVQPVICSLKHRRSIFQTPSRTTTGRMHDDFRRQRFLFFFLSARSLSVETWCLSTGHVWHTTF